MRGVGIGVAIDGVVAEACTVRAGLVVGPAVERDVIAAFGVTVADGAVVG